jgi:tyrosine decarboxylase / aspartate 1-decarboxylase
MPKPMSFPEKGLPEIDVLAKLMTKIEQNIPNEQNFSNSYAGPSHPFAKRAYDLGTNFLFVSGWGDPIYDGTSQLEKEAVRMVSSLLGLNTKDSVGFVTSGGTESNMLAVRMAKLVANKATPELIVPNSGHFSFDLAGHLMNVKIRKAPVTDDFRPDMDEVRKLINKNTVG